MVKYFMKCLIRLFFNAVRGPEGDEMALLAKAEITDAKEKLPSLEERIVLALTPKDDADERGVVIEVRAGTGKIK